jgi:hypothetical protein
VTAVVATMTVIKPFCWVNAIDFRGIVHRVISHMPCGVTHVCRARCGLAGRWSHTKATYQTRRLRVVRFTAEDVSCMACVVDETPR